jgi:hypothetical protein
MTPGKSRPAAGAEDPFVASIGGWQLPPFRGEGEQAATTAVRSPGGLYCAVP